MKEKDQKAVMKPAQFHKIGLQKFIDVCTLNETLIVTYSPKYAAYQRKSRKGQIERAKKFHCLSGKKGNPNDPMQFVKHTTVTADGKSTEKTMYDLDLEQIEKEAMYDGFYIVVTNLEGDVGEKFPLKKSAYK